MKNKKNRIGLTERKNIKGYFFVLPFICGLVFIFLPSVIESLVYSFNKVTIAFGHIEMESVGMDNYIKAVTEDVGFREKLLSALKGITLDLLIVLVFSFFIANILNQKFIGRGAARMIFFLPVILSTGIVASVQVSNSSLIDMGTMGALSNEADKMGGLGALFDMESFLMSSGLNSSLTSGIVYAIENTYNVINSSGVQILIFLSALQSISPSIFEAAHMEGATKWEEFWKITFPMISPMIFVAIVYTVVDTFTNPAYGLLDYIQDMAFGSSQMGYASAMSWIFFVIVMIFLGIITLLTSKRIRYS